MAQALALAVVAGALLRLWGLGEHGLWLDELFTVRAATRESWGGLLDELARDVHPPLFFAAMRLWGALAGEHDALWRLPGALAGLGTIVAAGVLGLRASGPAAGVLGAWFVALSPVAISLDREVRGNAFMVLFATAAAAVLAGAGQDRDERERLLFAALCACAVWTHVFGAFAVLGLLMWLYVRDDVAAAEKRRWALAGLAGCASFLLWVPVFLGQLSGYADQPWYVAPGGDSLSWLWLELFGGQVGPAIAFIPFVLLSLTRRRGAAGSLLLCGLLALVLLPQLLSYAIVPILRPRNVLPLLPLICVAAGAGVGAITRPALAGLVGLVMSCTLAMASVQKVHVEPVIEQWREAAWLVEEQWQPGQPVIANHPNLWRFYLPEEITRFDLYGTLPDAAAQAFLLLGHGDDSDVVQSLLARGLPTELAQLQGARAVRLDQLDAVLSGADFPDLPDSQVSDEGLHFYAVGGARSRPLKVFGRCRAGIRGHSDAAAGVPAWVRVSVDVDDARFAENTAELRGDGEWTWTEPIDPGTRPIQVDLHFVNDEAITLPDGTIEDRNAHVTEIRVRCEE